VIFYWAKTYEKMYENILLLTWFLDFDDIFQRWYIPSKKKKNQAFMLQAIKYQLERINIRFDEWFERVNKRDA
jgi:5,10-methylene-tetrahydrofolate dehydrogenase/methenyl tetrahydrofolate cyclohydrolase